MEWIKNSLGFVGYAAAAALSAWVAYNVTQQKFQWELNSLVVKDEEHERRLDLQETNQLFLERQVMDKLTIIHGDIRKIEGKLERSGGN